MLTLQDISRQIGGTLVGNPELLVTGPSEPKFASEQQLAMALSNKYITEQMFMEEMLLYIWLWLMQEYRFIDRLSKILGWNNIKCLPYKIFLAKLVEP